MTLVLGKSDSHIDFKKVADPPDKPLLLYDGTCQFCFRWAVRLLDFTGNAIQISPYQNEDDRFPEIPQGDLSRHVQLVDINGTVFKGAAAAYKVLSYRKGFQWFMVLYYKAGWFAGISESFYNLVSRYRHQF